MQTVQLKGNVTLARLFDIALSCIVHASLVIFNDKIFVGALKTTKSTKNYMVK